MEELRQHQMEVEPMSQLTASLHAQKGELSTGDALFTAWKNVSSKVEGVTPKVQEMIYLRYFKEHVETRALPHCKQMLDYLDHELEYGLHKFSEQGASDIQKNSVVQAITDLALLDSTPANQQIIVDMFYAFHEVISIYVLLMVCVCARI